MIREHISPGNEHIRVWNEMSLSMQTKWVHYAHRAWVDGYLSMPDNVSAYNTADLAIPHWKLMPVYGKVDDMTFFTWLSKGIFCVNQYMRNEAERDYLPERCRFHDTMGHLPILFNEKYSAFLRALGNYVVLTKGVNLGIVKNLYWAVAEFGICKEPDDAYKVVGAGILSSPEELAHVIQLTNAAEIIPTNMCEAEAVNEIRDTLGLHPLVSLVDLAGWEYVTETLQDRYYCFRMSTLPKLIRELWVISNP